MTTLQFYDDLAPFYDLIFEDWAESMARQGAALDRLFKAELGAAFLGASSTRVLDAACGIGTQALPLAERGYDVTARDLSSGAVSRIRQEAQARQLQIDAAVADMRDVAASVSGIFDIVLAFDNSVPHLTDDLAIESAFREFRSVLRPGGLCLCSVRDYDLVERGQATTHVYGERRRGTHTYRVWQDWAWSSQTHYQVALCIEEQTPDGPTRILRTTAPYYAIPIDHLLRLMALAGFVDCRRLDGAIYQPVLVGRAA